jgi:hypothetical protein
LADIIYIEDDELARLCARGDEKARKELYTRYDTFKDPEILERYDIPV